jgi:hypothetical protein
MSLTCSPTHCRVTGFTLAKIPHPSKTNLRPKADFSCGFPSPRGATAAMRSSAPAANQGQAGMPSPGWCTSMAAGSAGTGGGAGGAGLGETGFEGEVAALPDIGVAVAAVEPGRCQCSIPPSEGSLGAAASPQSISHPPGSGGGFAVSWRGHGFRTLLVPDSAAPCRGQFLHPAPPKFPKKCLARPRELVFSRRPASLSSPSRRSSMPSPPGVGALAGG